jgi:hypothetical protein
MERSSVGKPYFPDFEVAFIKSVKKKRSGIMLKTETLKLVRKFVVLSLMLISLAAMSSNITGSRAAAAPPPCCSYCDSIDCDGPGCNAALRACYRNCIQGC